MRKKREIKFRVWDGTKFLYDSDFAIYQNKPVKVVREKIDEYGDYYSVPALDNEYESVFFNDSLVLSQFTGLKDKNGVEIYEGDILLYKTDEINEDFLVCEYEEVNAWFVFNNVSKNQEDFYWMEIKNNCFVVGNIFENPEYLEQCQNSQ